MLYRIVIIGVVMQVLTGAICALDVHQTVPTLFMIADYGNEELVRSEAAGESVAEVAARVDQLVSTNHMGGVLFKGSWTPTGLKERIRHLQALSKTPLIFAQDLEWGLSMRHCGAIELPKALCMGAICDDASLEAWADTLARTARDVGITCFLGPVADVNSNPKNPVIHDRSFGDDPQAVAHKVSVVVKVLQRNGLAACAKHFPGHGNTAQDSHTHLPCVQATLEELEKGDLIPFKAAVEADVACLMTAHISLVNTPSGQTPASLSEFWATKKVRNDLGFTGVIITDDLIMAGALGGGSPAQAAVRAVKAGNDLCIVSRDVESCFRGIEEAVRSGEIPATLIGEHAKRVCLLQSRTHLSLKAPTLLEQMDVSDRLYVQALTAVGEPFVLDAQNAQILQVGNIPLCPLVRELVRDSPSLAVSAIRRNPTPNDIAGLISELGEKGELVVVLSDTERSAALSFGITPELIEGLKTLQSRGLRIRYVIFGSPYILNLLPKPVVSALVAYEKTAGSEKAVAEVLRGSVIPSGILPVKVGP